MIKVVTCIKRKAGMPVEEFQTYWRERHPAVVVRLPGLRRYVQSHTRLAGYRKAEPLYERSLGDFAKADRIWLEPLLEAMGDNADLLAQGDDNSFMNKLSLAVPGSSSGGASAPKGSVGNPPSSVGDNGSDAAKPKGRSHIRQARPQQPAVKLPDSGPMASMLKKLFGKD